MRISSINKVQSIYDRLWLLGSNWKEIDMKWEAIEPVWLKIANKLSNRIVYWVKLRYELTAT